MDFTFFPWLTVVGIPVVYLLGFLHAVDAILETRTAQGATAWAIALLVMPIIALPCYWVFGRAKFEDYIQSLRAFDRELLYNSDQHSLANLEPSLVNLNYIDDLRTRTELACFHELASSSFTTGNDARLLIDGEVTFKALFHAIDQANSYVLVQFYIIRDDATGQQFRTRLLSALKRGVQVYLLYDRLGSYPLSKRFLAPILEAGGHVLGSQRPRRWLGRLRLNFRNHRKLVVIDGSQGFIGGINVGDEYLGHHKKLSPWRDTHLNIHGPSVLQLQMTFLKDWYYSSKELLSLSWLVHRSQTKDQKALIIPSGPSDPLETCALLFVHAIESAEQRVWIATPYFVPDGRVLGALQLAALRGVDVRILMPRINDNVLFKYVPYAYVPDVERAGGKVYLYERGFMHQKAFLIDSDYAAISTANVDNRSFLFNFEITALLYDADFCLEVETMFLADMEYATLLREDALGKRSLLFKLATKTTRLLSPIL